MSNYKKQPKVRIKETGEVRKVETMRYHSSGLICVVLKGDGLTLSADEIEFITDDKVSPGTTTNHRIKMQNKMEEDKCVCGQEWVDEECPVHQPKNSIDSDTADKLRKNVRESRDEWVDTCSHAHDGDDMPQKSENCGIRAYDSDGNELDREVVKKVSYCCGAEWKHAFECYVDDMGNQKPYTCKSCGEPCEAVEDTPTCGHMPDFLYFKDDAKTVIGCTICEDDEDTKSDPIEPLKLEPFMADDGNIYHKLPHESEVHRKINELVEFVNQNISN